MSKEKVWGLMVYLSKNQWMSEYRDTIEFDESFWSYILEKCSETGINTILLEVGDGVYYESHPEIALKDSWKPEKVKAEVERCRALGIELVPKLNFSSAHSFWMKEYRNMTSSKPYYDFCSDVIKEIYELFLHPKYIHLGYDEEVPICCHKPEIEYQIMRRGKLLMDDFIFLVREVQKTGATPWAWHDPLWDHTEDYLKYVDLKENVILSPWYYMGLKKEHFTPIEPKAPDGTPNEWYEEGYRFFEEHPIFSNATEYFFSGKVLEMMEKGVKYIPVPSIYSSDYNTDDMVEFFKNGEPSEESIVGFLTAPWLPTLWDSKEKIDKSLELLAAARKKYYGE